MVTELSRWYDSYVAAFEALGRGVDTEPDRVLAFYAMPLLMSTDAGSSVLTEAAAVRAMLMGMIERLRAAGYHHSDPVSARCTVLNSSCALQHARFARVRADGSLIESIEVTYVITESPAGGRRISALVLHSPT